MKVGYRLSPNEEVQLLQAERERRRKVRLLQVWILLVHFVAFLDTSSIIGFYNSISFFFQ